MMDNCNTRDKWKRQSGLGQLQVFLFILVFVSGCRETANQPLTQHEILATDVEVPVHSVDRSLGAKYADLDVAYYYSGDSSEGLLITYFTTKDAEDQIIRVARMSTCRRCGQTVNTDETRGQSPVPITWASGYTGACRSHPPTYRSDPFEGDDFQSCLYWFDQDLNQYKLYTIWSIEEAANFANLLIVLDE